MIRKYHNHKQQTNPRHREEELQDNYSLIWNQNERRDTRTRIKQSNKIHVGHLDNS